MCFWKPFVVAGILACLLCLTLLAGAVASEGVPVKPTFERATIGVQLDPEASGAGASVYGVRVGSPADKAGLTYGDRIVSVDGETVEDWRALQRIIGQAEPGVARR